MSEDKGAMAAQALIGPATFYLDRVTEGLVVVAVTEVAVATA